MSIRVYRGPAAIRKLRRSLPPSLTATKSMHTLNNSIKPRTSLYTASIISDKVAISHCHQQVKILKLIYSVSIMHAISLHPQRFQEL